MTGEVRVVGTSTFAWAYMLDLLQQHGGRVVGASVRRGALVDGVGLHITVEVDDAEVAA
jgi:hypothetical protein